MIDEAGAIRVDARGLRCPWPALRLARAMREQPPGARVMLIADDPAVPREIAALAAEHGWQVHENGSLLLVVAPL